METKLDTRARGAQKAQGRGPRSVGGGFGLGPMPIEWMGGASSWTLPSGKALAEFALQAGFLAPLMLGQAPRTGFKRHQAKAANGNPDRGKVDMERADREKEEKAK